MSSIELGDQPRHVRTVARRAIAAVVVALVVLMVSMREAVQAIEAEVASAWIPPLLGTWGSATRNVLFLNFGPQGTYGFRISDGCSVVVLIAPILLFAAGMLALGRARGGRWAASIAVGLSVVIVVNQLRLWLLTWSTQQWGLDVGFHIAHVFAGSALAIIGFAAVIVLMLRLMTGHRDRERLPSRRRPPRRRSL